MDSYDGPAVFRQSEADVEVGRCAYATGRGGMKQEEWQGEFEDPTPEHILEVGEALLISFPRVSRERSSSPSTHIDSRARAEALSRELGQHLPSRSPRVARSQRQAGGCVRDRGALGSVTCVLRELRRIPRGLASRAARSSRSQIGADLWVRRAGGRIRTDDLPITSRLRYRTAPRRRIARVYPRRNDGPETAQA